MPPKKISNSVFFAEVLEQLAVNKEVTIPLRGTSMLPLLNEKHHNLVLSSQFGELQKGDIVLFRLNDSYILHRIRKIEGEKIFTQGDAVPYGEICTKNDVVAILVKIIDKRNGNVIDCKSKSWQLKSKKILLKKTLKRIFR